MPRGVPMPGKHALLIAAACLVALADPGPAPILAQAPAAALTGQVTSSEEGPMEGVLVSARQSGSTLTTTVVSDTQGRYRFPASRLGPGRYALSIRAIGYDLDGAVSV